MSYGPEADVWSAGVILYTLLSGAPPFWAETDMGIFHEILQGKLDLESEPWSGISDSAKDLIRKMLDRDPSTRLTAHEVLCHPWITDDSLAPDKPLDSAVISRLKHFSVMNRLKKMASYVEPSSAPPEEAKEPSSAPPEEPHTLEFKKPSSALPEEFKKLPKLKKPSWVLPHRTQNLLTVYSMGRKLGEGQFGITFLCEERATGTSYACKTIPKKKLIRNADYDEVRREIQIMHHLSEQPNVVRIQGTYEDLWFVHIVMELCAGGELFDRMVKKGKYSEREAAKLIKTVVGVVEACHSLGVMHRDLKPENFLFTNDGDDATLKATDFGLSVFFQPGETLTRKVGSPFYVAPEVLRKSYGPEADVWSAGVILYILLSGVPPFYAETDTGIFREILQAKLDLESEPWPGISDSAKDLIRKMLDRDPSTRLTAHEVLCHPWITDDSLAPDKPLDSAVLSRLKQFSGMNKLKKMALYVIAERLSEEEIGGLKELFKMIDTDDSGTITFEELKEGLRKFGCDLMEPEIKVLMEAVDIDNSGTIDYGEFLAATMHLNKLEREENLVLAFSFFDKDGSGYITIDEIQQACKQFGLSELNLEEIINLDQDNDGKIDYNEFAAMMRKGNDGIGRRTMRNTLNLAEALAIDRRK